jgi:hypothetical protein
MKNNINHILLGLMAITMFTWSSCKDDDPKCYDETNPECENYDPCHGKKPVTADFELGYILRVTPPFDEYVEEFQPDYAFERVNIGFRPKEHETLKYDKYTWLLGSEVIEEASFYRDFSGTTESEIPVTLIVEGKPDLECFPDDDGKDTLTKMIKLIDGVCNTDASGEFKVKFEGYSDSAVISVLNWGRNGGVSSAPFIPTDSCHSFGAQFVGFDPEIRSGSDTLWEAPGFYRTNSKHIYLRGSSNDYTISDGLFEVNKQGVIVGDYHIRVPIGKDETGTLFEDVPVKFKGRKLD